MEHILRKESLKSRLFFLKLLSVEKVLYFKDTVQKLKPFPSRRITTQA